MVVGIVLITAGILIALYPPLLSMIVAILLILLGSYSDHRWYGCIVLDVRMPGKNGLEERGGRHNSSHGTAGAGLFLRASVT
jgi:hypothetical protein